MLIPHCPVGACNLTRHARPVLPPYTTRAPYISYIPVRVPVHDTRAPAWSVVHQIYSSFQGLTGLAHDAITDLQGEGKTKPRARRCSQTCTGFKNGHPWGADNSGARFAHVEDCLIPVLNSQHVLTRMLCEGRATRELTRKHFIPI